MAKMIRTYNGKIPPCHNYIDMDCWIDDKTVLENPHKGWYWHFIDNGVFSGKYRDKNVPGDYLEDIKGLKIIYLRIDWCDIEKEEGVYDWSYIDSIMDEWGKKGFTFTFRMCTCESGVIDKDPEPMHGTPQYVFDKGAKLYAWGKTESGQTLYEPIYDDPIFLECLERFMKEFGRKFNGDKRVEYIDVGTFGTWGEAHCHRENYQTNFVYDNSVTKKHMDLHTKYFPDTQIIMNYAMPQHGGWNCKEENAQEIMEYAKTYGMGIRSDSNCVDWYSEYFQYDTCGNPTMFAQLNEDAPVDLELAHYWYLKNKGLDVLYKSGLPYLEAMKNLKATFAGFHGYPREYVSENPHFYEYCANRLGYWFFLNGARIGKLFADTTCTMDFFFENKGFARSYHKYDLKVKLVNNETNEEYFFNSFDNDCRKWQPNVEVRERVKLDLRGVKAGNYSVLVGLFEGERDIKLALKEDIYNNGYYKVTDIDIEMPL